MAYRAFLKSSWLCVTNRAGFVRFAAATTTPAIACFWENWTLRLGCRNLNWLRCYARSEGTLAPGARCQGHEAVNYKTKEDYQLPVWPRGLAKLCRSRRAHRFGLCHSHRRDAGGPAHVAV